MAFNNMTQSLSQERDKSLGSLEKEKSSTKKELRKSTQEQIFKIEESMGAQIEQHQMRAEMLKSRIGDLEATLSGLPSDHPEAKKIKKTIKSLKKDLAITKSKISTLRIRMRSQIQMARFRSSMQEKMRMIKFSTRKSLLLREFAERIMQAEQNQKVMSVAQTSSGTFAPPGSSSKGMQMMSPERGGAGVG